jgi:hypothetical protein
MPTPSSAFRSIQVVPRYGTQTCVVRWILAPGLVGGKVYVYRSPDGVAGWKLLNEHNPVIDHNEYEDTTFVVNNISKVAHYRLLLKIDGNYYDSQIVGLFETLRPKQYAEVRKIMNLEYHRMRNINNGVKVLLYKPKVSGIPCPSLDKDSDQLFMQCPDPEKDCYGTKFIGGYSRPMETWMEFMNIGPNIIHHREDGLRQYDVGTIEARALAYPAPHQNDLIVHVPTDNRYFIDMAVKPFSYRGLIPTAYGVRLKLAERNHPCYRVPIPADYTQ